MQSAGTNVTGGFNGNDRGVHRVIQEKETEINPSIINLTSVLRPCLFVFSYGRVTDDISDDYRSSAVSYGVCSTARWLILLR